MLNIRAKGQLFEEALASPASISSAHARRLDKVLVFSAQSPDLWTRRHLPKLVSTAGYSESGIAGVIVSAC